MPPINKLTNAEIDYLKSLSLPDFHKLLNASPKEIQLAIYREMGQTPEVESEIERTNQAVLMAKKRAAGRDLEIPLPKEVNRRLDCLEDPVLLLRTYFPSTFNQPFTGDRQAMLDGIIQAATYGGDQAIAGPRGEGKTRIAIYGSLYLMLRELSNFPIIIAKSGGKAANELRTLRERLQQSELLREDFPEICVPFHAVGNWASRAKMQTVNGSYTNIEIMGSHLIFPSIPQENLPLNWPAEIKPISNGQIISSMGIDGPIRGTNFRDKRPTLAILDDIEDLEAANSLSLIEKNETVIEKDIGGLGGNGRRVSRIMLCTIQNRRCIAYRYSDPEQKPSWRGKRYKKMLKPPSRIDLVDQYVELRLGRKSDDPDAREAHRFWVENRNAIESDCEVSNPWSFDQRTHPDGDTIEVSAIQSYYNNVADRGAEAVATEDDNDPPDEGGPEGMGLTIDLVASRVSGLDRGQVPANTVAITMGIDLGKYACHWVAVAWFKGGGGCVFDYGVVDVHGTETQHTHEASEPMIYRALLNWRDEMMNSKFCDSSGEPRNIDCVFVDSGAFTQAAYEFVRQVAGPFKVAKGVGAYRQRNKSSEKLRAGDNMHASYLDEDRVWLFELNTDYWKKWVHERFLTPTFTDQNTLRRGSLSLFNPLKRNTHLTFGHHICAEEWVTEFKEGKGSSSFWIVKNRNNHFLDATYYAAAAGRYCGVSLLETTANERVKLKPTPYQPKTNNRFTDRLKQRRGGWVQGTNRRRR